MKRVTYSGGKFSVRETNQYTYMHEESSLHFPDNTTDLEAVCGLYSGKWHQLDDKIQALRKEQQSLEQAYEAFLKTQEQGEE